MIRIDFSSKPCNQKRDRLYGIWLPALLLIVLTLINGTVFLVYRFRNSDIHQEIAAMEKQMSDLHGKVNGAAARLSRERYKTFIQKYQFLNHISQKKVLKWSRLFDNLADALPPSVKITVISPALKRDRMVLSISGEALTKADELLFVEALQKKSAFKDPFIDFEAIDSATHNLKFSLTVIYRGDHEPDA